jgi:hypothetical protein
MSNERTSLWEDASPRPWSADPGQVIRIEADNGNTLVCEIDASYESDAAVAEAYADAELICAAVNQFDALREALAKAIEVIEWCGTNDKTPTYGYGKNKDAQRRNGDLPGPGKAFNTPREFAAWWPERLRDVLNGGTLRV